jgi:hypothetical protein
MAYLLMSLRRPATSSIAAGPGAIPTPHEALAEALASSSPDPGDLPPGRLEIRRPAVIAQKSVRREPQSVHPDRMMRGAGSRPIVGAV